jgi:hypothetical protein
MLRSSIAAIVLCLMMIGGSVLAMPVTSAGAEGWGTSELLSPNPAKVPTSVNVDINDDGVAATVWLEGSSVMASVFLPSSGWTTAVQINSPVLYTVSKPMVKVMPNGTVEAYWFSIYNFMSNGCMVHQVNFTATEGWGHPYVLAQDWGTLATTGTFALDKNDAGQAVLGFAHYDGSVRQMEARVLDPISGWGQWALLASGGDGFTDLNAAIDATGAASLC